MFISQFISHFQHPRILRIHIFLNIFSASQKSGLTSSSMRVIDLKSAGRMTMLKMRVHQIQGQYSSDQEESLEYILEDYHGIIYFELL